MSRYSPDYITCFYDAYGDREWTRLTATPEEEVKLYIHTHYLQKHLRPGMHVLEVGAGAGRFTSVLAGLGCRVLVADISTVQLDLNRRHAQEEGFTHAVEAWQPLDICKMNVLADESFDAVVAYGGPLSYVFERAAQAAVECRRVLQPGGVLLASVMTMWGTAHKALRGVLDVPSAQNCQITTSGDITPENHPGSTHYCHMFRSGELSELLAQAGLNVLEMSASNCVSTNWNELLLERRGNTAAWEELLRMELESCATPGCLDMGTHLIAVARK